MTAASERLERCRSREGNRVRDELLFALNRVPKDSLIFTRAEVDTIADALGGYTKLAEVLDGPR